MTDHDQLLADVGRLRKPRPWLHVTPDGTASFYIRRRPYTDGDLDLAAALRAALATPTGCCGCVCSVHANCHGEHEDCNGDIGYEAVAGSATPTDDWDHESDDPIADHDEAMEARRAEAVAGSATPTYSTGFLMVDDDVSGSVSKLIAERNALQAEVRDLRAALATRPQPLWHGATQFIGTRDNPVVGRSLVGFTLDVPPGTPVALYAAPAGSAGEILCRIHDTFDGDAAGPAAILQAILDEEGPEGVVDAVLTAATESATPTEEER